MKFRPPVFDVRDLEFAVGGIDILRSVSFTVLPGEYCAIIGPNGGGKTTLVRMLLGLDRPDRGEIRLFGQPLRRFDAWHRIGYVPQRASQVDQRFPATAREVVQMGRIAVRGLFGRETREDVEAIEEAMERMQVTGISNRLIGELSGGQRQRVMIARALASRPEVLILDEPNTGVDMQSQQRFYSLLRDLNLGQKITVLFVTHDVGMIADDIQKLLFVNQTLKASGNPETVLSCEQMSRLYGIEGHLLRHGHRGKV